MFSYFVLLREKLLLEHVHVSKAPTGSQYLFAKMELFLYNENDVVFDFLKEIFILRNIDESKNFK